MYLFWVYDLPVLQFLLPPKADSEKISFGEFCVYDLPYLGRFEFMIYQSPPLCKKESFLRKSMIYVFEFMVSPFLCCPISGFPPSIFCFMFHLFCFVFLFVFYVFVGSSCCWFQCWCNIATGLFKQITKIIMKRGKRKKQQTRNLDDKYLFLCSDLQMGCVVRGFHLFACLFVLSFSWSFLSRSAFLVALPPPQRMPKTWSFLWMFVVFFFFWGGGGCCNPNLKSRKT